MKKLADELYDKWCEYIMDKSKPKPSIKIDNLILQICKDYLIKNGYEKEVNDNDSWRIN